MSGQNRSWRVEALLCFGVANGREFIFADGEDVDLINF